MSIAKRVARNTSFLAVSEIVHKVLFFFLIVYATRLLGPFDFGRFSFALAFGYAFSLLVNLGVSTYITRQLSRDSRFREKIGSIFTLGLALTFINTLLIAGLFILLDYPGDYLAIIVIMCLAVFFETLGIILQSVFKADEKMHYVSYARIFQVVTTFVLGFIVLFMLNANVVLFAAAYLAGGIAAAVMSIVFIVRNYARIRLSVDVKFWKSLLRKSFPFTIWMLFGIIFFRIDTIMLSWMQGDVSVGLYNAAYQIVGALLFIPGVYCMAIFPLLAMHYKKNSQRFERIIRLSVKYLVSIGLPMAVGITLISQRLVEFLYGAEYFQSHMPLEILIWTGALIFLLYLFSNSIIAMNKEKTLVWIYAWAMVLNIVLNFFLIARYNYNGAAAATVITQLFIFSCYIWILVREKHRLHLASAIARPVIASSLMAVFLVNFSEMNLFLAIPIGFVIYVSAFLLMKGLSKEDVNLIKEVMGKRN